MVYEHIILAFLWIGFCLLHSLLADLKVKGWMATLLGKQFTFYRLYYTLFAFISFGIVVGYQVNLASVPLFETNAISKVLGWVLMLSGLIIMGICIYKYFMNLSGIKSLFVDQPSTGNVLIVSGIHQYVRHPLYLGTFIFIWGLFIIIPLASLLISNFVITSYTLIGISFEEKKLVHEFGNSYLLYKKRVPMIIPSLRRKNL